MLIVLLTRKKKVVYLKPKEKTPTENNSKQVSEDSPVINNQETQVTSFDPTHANDNSDVARSDLKDLRQSTVALGVSQKDGSNQIVQDWLDTSPDENASSEGNVEDEVSE